MKVRVVQAETGGRPSFSLSQAVKDKAVASSHRGRPSATPRKNHCDCGFLKSSVDAKEDTSRQGSDCRVRHTYAEWEREAVVAEEAAENGSRGQDEGRWPAG